MTMLNRPPPHWSKTRLEDLFDILDSRRVPVNSEERATREGAVPYYGATGQAGWIDKYIFDEDLVLLGEDGAPFLDSEKPKAYVIRGKSWVNNHAHVLRARFGPQTLWKHQLDCVDYHNVVSGTTRLKLPQGPMKGIQLLVPPLPEQVRLVDAIDSYLSRLDAAVATLEAAQKKLKAYRASVLKAAVEGRLVPTEAALARAAKRDFEPADVLLKRILSERRRRWEKAELAKLKAAVKSPKDDKWKSKYEEPKPPDTKGLPALPAGWCWASVEQLSQIASGQTPNGITDDCTTEGEIPWFRVGDMNTPANEVLMTVGSAFVSSEQAAALGLHVRPTGTIIFPKRGGAIATNKKRRLSRPSAYDLNTMGLVADSGVAAYLWTWFLGIDLGRLSDGSNVPQINNSDIGPLRVPLPPAKEQVRVCEEVERLLSASEAVRGQVGSDARRCIRLRQAILKWAFEGKLVDQDPNDEPAEKLLERIRAERTNTEKPQKARRP
jgi:type I restriction enzyme S subunit